MKRVSDLYFAGYELCSTEENNTVTNKKSDDSKNVKNDNHTENNKVIIRCLHNIDYTLYLSPYWDRKQEIQNDIGECKKVTNTDISIDKSTNSPGSVNNETMSMTNVNVNDIDICYVYDECELLEEDKYKKDEKEGLDCKELEFTELWIHGCELERLQSSYEERNTKSKHKDNIDKENMPEKLILLGYTYNNDTLVYLLSVAPNNQAEIWECTSLKFVQHHYRLVASIEKEVANVTTYAELQELIYSNINSIASTSRACRLPVMWRSGESSTHDTHSSLWYSPALEQFRLSEVYQISVAKIYYFSKWQKYIRFVGVSCAVPWVCDVTNLSTNTFSNKLDANAERIIFACPLPNCYSYETLLREYEMSDAEQNISLPCKIEKHDYNINHNKANEDRKKDDEREEEEGIQEIKFTQKLTEEEQQQEEEEQEKEKQRTLLEARQACNECEWMSHFAKCVQISRNMAIVKGDYGVILSCEIASPMLSRLKLSCKDRLVCLPETGKQYHEQTEHKHISDKNEKLTETKCTVVGTCGEHLVVLYDDRDTVHLIREFPLRTETDVALHFVREGEIDQGKLEEEEENNNKVEEEEEDKRDSISDTLEKFVENEYINSSNDTNVETHESKARYATEFTDFLIAHAVTEIQAQNSKNDNAIDNVSSDKVFEYYYNGTNTLEKMMNALHAYQENNIRK